MTSTTRIHIGAVSSDTLRGEDLLPTFADELKALEPTHALVREAYDLMAEWGSFETDEEEQEENEHIDNLVNDIQDALNEYAPVFLYFGASEGDGACFGWWPNIDALNDERRYTGRHSKKHDMDYLPESNVWVSVSDHGNVTVYADDNGKPGAYLWSCV